MYYVVIDLEMCKVPKTYYKTYSFRRETIQFGAALLDENYEIIDKFNRYVKPQFGNLDIFIQKLTGINKKQLTKGTDFRTTFQEFMDWLPEGEVVPISWSMTDRSQLEKEMTLKGIEISERFQTMLDSWIDCQPQFTEKMDMGKKLYNLGEALIAADIIYDENAHDGLVDACNTALLYAKMQREEKLVLNPYYAKAHSDEQVDEVLTYSLAALMEQAMRNRAAC